MGMRQMWHKAAYVLIGLAFFAFMSVPLLLLFGGNGSEIARFTVPGKAQVTVPKTHNYSIVEEHHTTKHKSARLRPMAIKGVSCAAINVASGEQAALEEIKYLSYDSTCKGGTSCTLHMHMWQAPLEEGTYEFNCSVEGDRSHTLVLKTTPQIAGIKIGTAKFFFVSVAVAIVFVILAIAAIKISNRLYKKYSDNLYKSL